MKLHSNDTSLRNMTHNTSIPNQISQFCAYFWLKLVWNFIKKRPSCEIRHITLLFQINLFRFCAYFWLKLLWHFIQRIPPWDIWLVTLLFKIIISWIFAYCWLKVSMKFHSNDTFLRNKTCNSSIENHYFMNFW